MDRRVPNIGLQRIRLRSVPELRRDELSACGLAAEAGSFARMSIVAAAVLVVGLGLFVQPVAACSCIEPENLKAAVRLADAVFVGEGVSIDAGNNGTTEPPQVVNFKASEAWKGVTSADVKVSTGGAGDCSEFDFAQGKRYLVFAKRTSEGLSTGQCMGDFWVWRDYELRDIRKWRSGKKLTK